MVPLAMFVCGAGVSISCMSDRSDDIANRLLACRTTGAELGLVFVAGCRAAVAVDKMKFEARAATDASRPNGNSSAIQVHHLVSGFRARVWRPSKAETFFTKLAAKWNEFRWAARASRLTTHNTYAAHLFAGFARKL